MELRLGKMNYCVGVWGRQAWGGGRACVIVACLVCVVRVPIRTLIDGH